MALTIEVEQARTACAESVEAFLAAAESLDELDLLAASRCHGWARLDVVVHVIGGWQEMLGGFVAPVDSEPTVDAASYWPAFTEQYAGDDPVADLMAQRRRTAAYSRPASALAHLHDVAEAVLRGTWSIPDRPVRWQGHVFTAGDFLAIWAVEDVVHLLDLDSPTTAPPAALDLAHRTVDGLGPAAPPEWAARLPPRS